ncbi:MAG: hypothetical protein ABJA78_04345 [Ferruginibacter sp.]
MLKIIQKTLIVSMLLSTALSTLADRGIGKKTKNKISLNIATVSTLRSSISYNLKSGLTYKGSIQTNNVFSNRSMMNNTIVTYQKGNTVYIIPYKQKIVIPDTKQGYVGMKLIIRPH